MEAIVIAPFIDKRTSKRINAGDPLPDGMTEERLGKLVRAGCVQVIQSAPIAPIAPPAKPKRTRKTAAQRSAEAETLFPDIKSAEEIGPGTSYETAADPEALAGGDGGDTGAGSELDGAGLDAGDGESQDDSGR
jgi:hypothetical protein